MWKDENGYVILKMIYLISIRRMHSEMLMNILIFNWRNGIRGNYNNNLLELVEQLKILN
ncbi:hypothetical protein SMSRO_SF029540 [Spiroplasma poulsonii]|uniref:Uncharacterized protein n=1 Tax=Spiroplasma poulsonii TaxID=2138 RepID=A0A2P6F8N6_9MOLU|nr:hypothetical protein SMSRO_SF029540 [Spiroplasma poulsonii]